MILYWWYLLMADAWLKKWARTSVGMCTTGLGNNGGKGVGSGLRTASKERELPGRLTTSDLNPPGGMG